MTEDQLTQMETALGIALPTAYRKSVVPFPVPAYSGNSETELWDDADQLVELNQEFRAGTALASPWPPHLFALGRDGSGCARAIDLRNPACPVWWAEQYLADLRSDLDSTGGYPDGSPEARERTDDENASAGCQSILLLLGGLVLVIAVILGFIAWFTR